MQGGRTMASARAWREPLHAIANYKKTYRHRSNVATTTIQLSTEMKGALEGMKLHPRETYEDVLERLLEDLRELNEETKIGRAHV